MYVFFGLIFYSIAFQLSVVYQTLYSWSILVLSSHDSRLRRFFPKKILFSHGAPVLLRVDCVRPSAEKLKLLVKRVISLTVIIYLTDLISQQIVSHSECKFYSKGVPSFSCFFRTGVTLFQSFLIIRYNPFKLIDNVVQVVVKIDLCLSSIIRNNKSLRSSWSLPSIIYR